MVVEKAGPASASKAACCGCFRRRKRNSLVLSDVYYHASCIDHARCAERSHLGPPENKCDCTDKFSNIMRETDTTKLDVKKKMCPVNDVGLEIADDAISLNEERPSSRSSLRSLQETGNPYIQVNGKEEFVEEIKNFQSLDNSRTEAKTSSDKTMKRNKNLDGNYNKLIINKVYGLCTLPKRKTGKQLPFLMMTPPKRITPDGTHIYYWCDLDKKNGSGKVPSGRSSKFHRQVVAGILFDGFLFFAELDDGAYNPLWTMRGFTQTFHFWKETRGRSPFL